MYVPPHFAEHRPEELHRILRAHPLGALVTAGEGGPEADHLPFEFDAGAGAHGVLRAHVARANGLWRRCAGGCPALAIFRGAEAYVSPNWYPSKHATHRQVPTWNYEAVHAHGILRAVDDATFVRGLLARLTRRHEAGEARPWRMGDAPPDFLDRMLAAVVGIELEITRLEGKRKLSQNKEARDGLAAAAQLEARGGAALAEAMRRAFDGR
ncbi:MAG: FMN-binding negative transcriptional regulator [Xylophilus ampelinus]